WEIGQISPPLPPFGLRGVGRRPPRATVCTKPGKGRIFTPVREPSGESWFKGFGDTTSMQPCDLLFSAFRSYSIFPMYCCSHCCLRISVICGGKGVIARRI